MARTNGKFDITATPYYRYALDGVEGRIVMGELTRLACKRFLNDLKRDDLVFRFDIIEKFSRFASMFKHFKGSTAGKPFVLEDWEWFMFANILGWYWKDSGLRRFTSNMLCISRKQGKSACAALLTLWFLLGDGEAAPECALAANARDQAAVLYTFVKEWARQIDPREKDLKILRNGIECKSNLGKVTVFAADAQMLDGHDISYFCVDEYGGAKTSAVYDVLRSAQGQRKNPVGMVISTAGFLLDSPFKKMYDMYVEILHGLKEDDSSFALIFAIDENDNYEDEKVWPKIAPNLNVTVSEKYLREQVTYAKNNPSAAVGVMTKNFNMFCSSATVWLPDSYIMKVMDNVSFDDFNSRNTVLYVGIDLASTSDLACVSLLFTVPKDSKLYFKNLYYLPESALETSTNKELYKYWARTGQLTLTPGNVCDYDYVLNDLLKIRKKFVIRTLGIDAWNASQFSINCTENGLPTTPISQSLSNLNRPTKELERLIRMGTDIVIDSNEITLFCFRNAVPKYDEKDNVKIIKTNYESKIDGTIAIIMALCSYLDTPRFRGGVSSV